MIHFPEIHFQSTGVESSGHGPLGCSRKPGFAWANSSNLVRSYTQRWPLSGNSGAKSTGFGIPPFQWRDSSPFKRQPLIRLTSGPSRSNQAPATKIENVFLWIQIGNWNFTDRGLTQRGDVEARKGSFGKWFPPRRALISFSASSSALANSLGRTAGAPEHSSPNRRRGTHQHPTSSAQPMEQCGL